MTEAPTNIVPFGGWLLDCVAEIDLQRPGIIGHLLRASPERRQVIAAFLSRTLRHREFQTPQHLGEFLITANHDQLLEAAFGAVPRHLRAVLRRGGAQPYPRRHYEYVCRLLASSARPEMASLLLRLNRVNPKVLKIARALRQEIRFANLVEVLSSSDDARDLSQLFDLLSQHGVSRTAMIQSLREVKSARAVRKFASMYGFRVRLPSHPAPATNTYRPILDGTELRAMARQFKNCGRNYLTNVLEGRSSFALVKAGSREAVVHLIRCGERWVLEDLYATANSAPDDNVQRVAVMHLATVGIERRAHRRSVGQWGCLRRLAGHFDFADDL